MTEDEIAHAAQARLLERRKREGIVSGGLQPTLGSFDSMLAKYAAEKRDDPEGFARREAEAEEKDRLEQEELARDAAHLRRYRSLRGAGLDDATCETLAGATNAPPVVNGHKGSSHASRVVSGFVRQRRIRMLYLWGPTGHGKSWAALWAVALPGSALVSGTDIQPGDDWSEKRANAERADLLVFDELGGEYSSEWFTSEAARLLEARQTKGLRSIVTGNLPPAFAHLSNDERAELLKKDRNAALTMPSVATRYGDRLIDRMLDTKAGFVTRVQGDRSIRSMVSR